MDIGSFRARVAASMGLAALFLQACLGVESAQAAAERNPFFAPAPAAATDTARVIIKFRADSALLRRHMLAANAGALETRDVLARRAASLGARLGVELSAGRALHERAQVVTGSGMSSQTLARRLAEQADVEYAVVDHRRRRFAVPNDTYYLQGPPLGNGVGGPVVGQWYLRAPAGDVVSSINAARAWDVTTGSAAIVVADLDSGVRPEHPDLIGRLLPGYDMISDIPTANDGGGRDSDPSDPGDWISAQEDAARSGPFYQCGAGDSSWHGTQTISLIGAASNNGTGMAGVAWNVGLLPVRVMGKCGGLDSDIIAGMLWAAGLPVPGVPTNPNPARVINLSLGAEGSCESSYIDAINSLTNKANPVVVVVAAGNSTGHAVNSPANCPGAIAVAGLRHTGTKVGYSDMGPEVAISAPAGNCVNTGATDPCLYPIIAATNTGTTVPLASSYSDAFNASTGTSFSTPLVTGTVALMLSLQPSLTPAQVKSLLQSSARAFPTAASTGNPTIPACHAPTRTDQEECYCTTSTCGAGMLDVGAVVAKVKEAAQRDCLFSWAETSYSSLFAPAATSRTASPYYYRYYTATKNYLGINTDNNHLYFLSNNVLTDLGSAAPWYATAGCP